MSLDSVGDKSVEVYEISDDESEDKGSPEPVPSPPPRRKTVLRGPPSTPSPVKASCVIDYFILLINWTDVSHLQC